MDCYEIWCDLAPGVKDLEFVESVQAYLDCFVRNGDLHSYRIRRRKFGFGPSELGEFCMTLEFESLAKLDQAFSVAATRDGVIEELHSAVYSRVRNFRSALYRDFPDSVRVR